MNADEKQKQTDSANLAIVLQLFQEYRSEREKMRRDLDAAHNSLRKMRKDRFGWKAWLKATATLVFVELAKVFGPWLLAHIR